MTGRKWRVQFLGDPDYGRDEFTGDQVDIVEAPDASTAARRALGKWRRVDAHEVRDAGWYGDGTIIGVQEIVAPPPVRVFVRQRGRLKLERP